MRFPLNNFNFEVPINDDLGAFGVIRKFDRHTGVDLYCENGDEVYAMEDGEVVAIEWFTGEPVGMPWWNDTKAIAIKGKSGILNYCELIPLIGIKVGDKVIEGKSQDVIHSEGTNYAELKQVEGGQFDYWYGGYFYAKDQLAL